MYFNNISRQVKILSKNKIKNILNVFRFSLFSWLNVSIEQKKKRDMIQNRYLVYR